GARAAGGERGERRKPARHGGSIARLTGGTWLGRLPRSSHRNRMAVALRFSRQGKKKNPFYRIVATDKRAARDGRFIELLGTYHPVTKALQLDTARYDRWIKVGARPTGTLAAVIRRVARETAKASAAPGKKTA